MSELTLRTFGALTDFKPEETKMFEAKIDALIDYAKKVKDWPLLAEAIDAKLQLQGEFVGWWDKTVSARQGGGEKLSHRSAQKFLPMEQAEERTEIKHQQVSKWRRRLSDPEAYKAMLIGIVTAKAMAEEQLTTAAKWTGDPESYTPKRYIEAARSVMGAIDLDPASNAMAQQTVRAEQWFDEAQDGLKQDWSGRVFLNPPYKHPAVANFIDKLCDAYGDGHVASAILLTNNNTDTRWFHRAATLAASVCFTAGRINFYKADGSTTQPTNGQAFFYFGNRLADFLNAFGSIGLVMSRAEGS